MIEFRCISCNIRYEVQPDNIKPRCCGYEMERVNK